MSILTRTPGQIVGRIAAVASEDIFGVEQSSLLEGLDYEPARPWLKPDVTPAGWPCGSAEYVRTRAVEYLTFAFGKARDHRGLSASRSVDHYRGWLWLLCPDDTYEQWLALDYAQYGVPQLVRAAILLGVEPALDEPLRRMSQGEPCTLGCTAGCGL